MKRLFAKVRRIRMTRWAMLTTGERIAKFLMDLVKVAVIVAIVVAVLSAAFALALGIAVAFGMANAIAGGFTNASRAYRPGDRYVRFW